MRNLYFFIISLLISAATVWGQTATAPAGSGTQADPYQIATLDNLYWVTQNSSSWGSYFIQTANIDASSSSTWDGGQGFLPIGSLSSNFTGNYNGQNYTINGLFINRTYKQDIGFFGVVNNATISNVGLNNVDITADYQVGALVGTIQGTTTISNCYSTGSVTAPWTVGGLLGAVLSGSATISNSYSSCTINGGAPAGGFTGSIESSSSISNCYSTGAVSGNEVTGGFVGSVYDAGVISDCYSTSGVTRNAGQTFTTFGAFCGGNGTYPGAFIEPQGGTIKNSYATGSVTYSGTTSPTDKGFSGYSGTSGGVTYTNNFFDSQTTGQSSDAAGGGTAKTTAEMQDVTTFTNTATSAGLTTPVWDFVTNPNDDSGTNDYWDMDQAGTVNNGYPILSWQPGADQTLPVNLAAFSATPGDGQVLLKWSTASEINNKAFLIERSEDDGTTFMQLAELAGQGNKNSRTDYSYRDLKVFNGVTYHYRLSDIDYNGHVTQLQIVSVTPQGKIDGEEVSTIDGFTLYPAYPNPFNPQTTFGFDLPERSVVTLVVYDLHGNRVRELVSGERESGVYKITFDASRLASGVYFYRFTARGMNSGRMFSQSRRVMLIK